MRIGSRAFWNARIDIPLADGTPATFWERHCKDTAARAGYPHAFNNIIKYKDKASKSETSRKTMNNQLII